MFKNALTIYGKKNTFGNSIPMFVYFTNMFVQYTNAN